MKYPIAALFPGQGSQRAGMITDLLNQFPWTQEIFEEASDAISVDLKKLCLEGPEDVLQLTENAQPCILVTSYSWYQVLKRTLDFAPAAGAGHSLGEYSALLASEAMTLSEAVRLVRRRGQLMQTEVPQGKGKMAAVLGLDDSVIEAVCKASSDAQFQVSPANYNSPGQLVVAGHAEAVDRMEQLVSDPTKPEWKARKFIPLKVSAPFHCPLMSPVAQKFEGDLKKVAWSSRRFGIAHNLDTTFRKEGDLVALLRDQIDHPVRWTGCQKTLEGLGITTFVEMGPGRVLAGLGKRICSDGEFHSLESFADFQKFERTIQENRK